MKTLAQAHDELLIAIAFLEEKKTDAVNARKEREMAMLDIYGAKVLHAEKKVVEAAKDFAYYLMKDDKTLIMVSAIKNINQSFKFDISTRKLQKYSTKGKLDFIVSSITKYCGFTNMDDTYKCNYYKPLISQNLIN